MDLKDNLKQYKDITLELISNVEKDNFEILDMLLSNRQNVIDEIEKLNYTKEEFLNLCKELNILVLQQKLTKLMNMKKANLRNDIDALTNSQNANKSYNKKFAVDSVFFNKKI